MRIIIKPYQTEYQKELVRLLRLNTPKFFAAEEEGEFVSYLELETEQYYVLHYDGKVVGCGGINSTEDRTEARLSWDIFHPDYQRIGLGTQLLEYRIQKLRLDPVLRKVTVRTSQTAYEFYKKQGFELNETRKNYWAEGFDLYLMSRKI